MRSIAFSTVFLVAVLALEASPARALPDLVPEIFNANLGIGDVDPGDVVEGCAGAQTGRRLLRFSLRSRNVGADDLVLGDPGCPNCSQNPGAACANPLFECSEAHGHAHFESFAHVELVANGGAVVGESQKVGFCLLDLECASPQYHCGFQGISAGCADVYDASLPCQYIDLTDAILPDGLYTLRVTLDPQNVLVESDEANNVVSMPFQIGSAPPPSCPVYVSTDVPKTIADLGSASSTLAVPTAGVIDRVRVVDLRGQHTYVRDLEFHLKSPANTDVIVMDRVCADHDDFDIDLGDAAINAIPCPPTDGGLHLPSNPLSAFAGESLAGTWELEVFDRESQDEGTLTGFGLEICTVCGNGITDPGEACDDGNTAGGDCCASDCQSLGPDGIACTDGNACSTGETCAGGACGGGSAVTCDPCLACYPETGCSPPASNVCQNAAHGRSVVRLDRNADPERDRLTWVWRASLPVPPGDFGLPTSSTDLRLCVFDQTGLKLSAVAPAGGLCDGAACWRSVGAIRYRDRERTPDGLQQMTLVPGAANRATINVRGGGANLALPPLDLSLPVTVRLRRDDGSPICWQSTYGSAIRRTPLKFHARSN